MRTTAYAMLDRVHRHWCRAGCPGSIVAGATPTQHWVSISYWKALIVASRTSPEYTAWGTLLADYGFPTHPTVDYGLGAFLAEPIAPHARIQTVDEATTGLGSMMWYASTPQGPREGGGTV